MNRPSTKRSDRHRRLTQRQSAKQHKLGEWPDRSSHSVGRLVFDSEVDPVFVGLRAAGRAATRRLRYEAEGSEIDFELAADPDNGRLRLVGQITPSAADDSGGWLRLLRGSNQWLVRLDERGEFRLDSLESGVYRLEFAFKDRVIELPVLPV
jgi:hypothetical protein